MNGPIVSQCGWTQVEFRPVGNGMWEITSAGQGIGYACVDAIGAAVATDRISLGRATLELAAVALAEKLHDDYLDWQRKAPARALGRLS